MSDPERQKTIPTSCDVVIIGAGPAGLAAATHLSQAGISNLVVLERETQAGGIPRHCGHPPFAMGEFKRIMTGSAYASALVARAEKSGVAIFRNTTVVRIHEHGRLSITSPEGATELAAKVVILSTGVRETPRAPRLVGGQRPLGIVTTGALQSMVYLKHKIPFRQPVIIGSELVSFSALLTCRHAGIKTVAMVDEDEQVTARAVMQLLPKLLGVPMHFGTRLCEILGHDRVTGIRVKNAVHGERTIACDGVIFSGQFRPDSSLMRMGHIHVDQASGGPLVDQYGRCSDPGYFATGNLLRPVETAGWSWREGVQTGAIVAQYLSGQLPARERLVDIVTHSPVIKYVMPQVIALPFAGNSMKYLQLRFLKKARGRLSIHSGSNRLWSKMISTRPERRVLIPLSCLAGPEILQPIDINFEER